jgi:hypothetical protein
MTGMWRSWMTAWCWAVGLFGALLTGGASEATDGPVRLLFEAMGSAGAPEMTPHLRFATALMGAVTLGWACTLMTAVRAADRLGAPVWQAITGGIVVWFAVDSALSVATGFALNAASNTVFLIAYLIPVFASGVLGERRMAFTPSTLESAK